MQLHTFLNIFIFCKKKHHLLRFTESFQHRHSRTRTQKLLSVKAYASRAGSANICAPDDRRRKLPLSQGLLPGPKSTPKSSALGERDSSLASTAIASIRAFFSFPVRLPHD